MTSLKILAFLRIAFSVLYVLKYADRGLPNYLRSRKSFDEQTSEFREAFDGRLS